MDLKGLVERTDTTAGRLFDIMIQALIIISLVSFSVDTLPDLSASARQILSAVEVGTIAIFTVEYILRVAIADRRLGYIFSFFGLIDLLAILPFYITSGVDLRAVRAFRLLRLLRALKLVRYSQAIQRFHRAFQIAREEIVLFFGVACILLFLADASPGVRAQRVDGFARRHRSRRAAAAAAGHPVQVPGVSGRVKSRILAG